jgi:hypothetical protein
VCTLKARLGVDVDDHPILGNPPLAHRALQIAPQLGL